MHFLFNIVVIFISSFSLSALVLSRPVMTDDDANEKVIKKKKKGNVKKYV